ncbi:gluconokinase [Mycoplana sp. BE70]|uniref:gluconokinase n=1 Tax=Mycoplana sp. BE70 TaxID=2817775 RepID=UPI00285A06BE|nr:gluconokinase [Mycoplana sp. BE70]MDR6759297.1 gluconokinase [Mycoplana sp. BE70]
MAAPIERRKARSAGFVLVMGVSGAGKSTIGRALADSLGAGFVEADDYHSAGNIEKMAAGQSLSDDDRWPWMKAIAEAAEGEVEKHGGPVVIACSALKKSYRDFLRARLGSISIVHLSGAKELIHERLQARQAHFMPAELLASQLATLEALAPEEGGIALSIGEAEDAIVSRALQSIGGARN